VIAAYVPAAQAAARLRALGAGVTFVLPPSGDALRVIAPSWYEQLHGGSEDVTLDLKAAAGRDALEPLLAGADVLFTALRPSSLARLGLAWDSLHARHPRLSHVAIVGYPPPRDEEPGHDLTYQASAGLLSPPAMPRSLIADLAGAEQAALAAVSLVLAREQGRGAGHRLVSLAASAEAFADPLRHGATAPDGVLGGALPGYDLYQASDGWVAVGALEPHFFHDLCAALGEGAAAGHADLRRAFAAGTMAHWEAWAAARALPVVAVR
jgi:alpha-methylacyl-CoA racemase